MRHIIMLIGFCIVGIGCNGATVPPPEEAKDPTSVYETVLREYLKDAKGEGCYLSVDGKDPAPELLKQLNKHWPELQAASKAPAVGKKNGVSVSDLNWLDRDTAQVRGGFSNGMDGHGARYRVVRKNGVWSIAGRDNEVMS